MAWLSHVPRDAAGVLAALSIAYIANVSSGVSYVVGAAAGAPGIAARAAVGTAALNLALTAALAPLFGIWGVLAGTVVALTAGALAQVVLVHRKFSLSLFDYRDSVLPTLAAGTLLALPIAVISYSGIVTDRALAIVAVLVVSVAYLLAYGRWAFRSGRVPETVARRFSAGLSGA
jgi:O-antigen/teichoic acid export membrane protein